MAEERNINGEAADSFFDTVQQDDGAKTAEMSRRIGELESQNQELTRDNFEMSQRIEKLTAEIEKLRVVGSMTRRKMGEMELDIDKADEERKVLDAIAARAAELETEIVRLQHDLVTAMNEGEEASAEAKKLAAEISQKGVRIEELEKEVAGFRAVNEENEKRMKELETKLGLLEVKELEERNKKFRAEEEMKEKIDQKEKEIDALKKIVEGLESDVAEGKTELQKWITEKSNVEMMLRESEMRVAAMEEKMVESQRQLGQAEDMISGLKNMVEPLSNGTATDVSTVKSWYPAASVGSGGAVAAAVAVAATATAVVCYNLHSKRV